MMITSLHPATRARPLRIQNVVIDRAVAISSVAGIRQRQQARGFRFDTSYYYFNNRPCRKNKRRDGAPKRNSAEKTNRSWPFDHSSWAWEDAYRATVTEYWSKSRLGFPKEPHKDRGPETEPDKRPDRDAEDFVPKLWIRSLFENAQGEKSKNQRQWPESENRGLQGGDSQPRAFYIDPITNRKVSLRSQDSEEERQNSKPTDVGTAKSGSDLVDPVSFSSEHQPDSIPHGQEGYTKEEAINSPSDSEQPNTRYDDLHKYRPIIAEASIPKLDESPVELSPHESDNPPGQPQQHFNDLKPPPDSTLFSQTEIAAMVDNVEQLGGELQHSGNHDESTLGKENSMGSHNDSHDSDVLETGHISAQENSSSIISDIADYQTLNSSNSDPKPAGYVEDFVAPERLHEYPCIVESIKPGDFSRSTVEDLLQKYSTAEVKKYTAVRCHEINGQSEASVQKVPTNQDSPKDHQHLTNGNGHGSLLSELPSEVRAFSHQVSDHEDPKFLAAEELDSFPRLSKVEEDEKVESARRKRRAWLESMKQLSKARRQHEMSSDAADREAILAIRRAKAILATRQAKTIADEEHPKKEIVGNYVRDFPEEFEQSWTHTLSKTPTEPFDNSDQQTLTSEGQSMDGGLEGAFGQPGPSKIQPALDRHHRRAREPAESSGETSVKSSPERREAKMSDARDSSDYSVEPLSMKHDDSKVSASETFRGNSDAKARDSAKVLESRPQQGTSTMLYKILAYDPTMQTINIAETSSLVADFTSALSPAAALSRLSHPTKFFPHFASLEAEGFEIVSGSGDVLVFRKTRSSAAEREANKAETDTYTAAAATNVTLEPNPTPINPIDMTGRPRVMTPASANFASPTGYVAYPEIEAMDLPPPPPRVKYNINLRREEPVYSGPKTRSYDGRERHTKSLGKRLLVGGVWVAGISYGLGVVSEYFATGGMDGTGPTGF